MSGLLVGPVVPARADEPGTPTPTEATEPAGPTEPSEPSEPSEPTEPSEPSEPTEPADYRFLSSPDFLNGDVGDVTRSGSYRNGQPNSINDDYRDALRVVMDVFAAEQPDDVFVAGDLVEGHWGLDSSGTGTFGPVRTYPERVAAVRRAGRLYFRQWRSRFSARGLDVHAAVGDHELGDNPWARSGAPYPRFKHRAFGVFKDVFADHIVAPQGYRSRPAGPAHATAYAVRLHREVLLVTVDVFRRTDTGVVSQLDPRQLAWLERVLARAQLDGVDWTIVQGHTPVLGPVRQRASSGLYYSGGRTSPFWRTMRNRGVDLYLSGEVHEVTAIRRDGVTQVSHGGIFTSGGTNYLLGEVRGDRLALAAVDLVGRSGGPVGPQLWQTDARKTPSAFVTYDRSPVTTGTMVLGADRTVRTPGSGTLAPWESTTDKTEPPARAAR
ncbi:metallophosphoesterase [Nocardioides perillae]|uniref:Calcineurin-like phosphoesterase domain-containing protein n=1 Tax=Nocardioides perillae TaxID=1119534 RepID=A0A7Y9RW46_9ACTN|nr:hypothetical protein [Nocardioides perillae]